MVDKALTDTPPAVLPPDPEKSGWHWLTKEGDQPQLGFWMSEPRISFAGDAGTWIIHMGYYGTSMVGGIGYRYVAPVDPPGTATALDEARAEVARLRQEIRRLKTIIRINALRHGYTDAEIEAVLSPRAAGTAQ